MSLALETHDYCERIGDTDLDALRMLLGHPVSQFLTPVSEITFAEPKVRTRSLAFAIRQHLPRGSLFQAEAAPIFVNLWAELSGTPNGEDFAVLRCDVDSAPYDIEYEALDEGTPCLTGPHGDIDMLTPDPTRRLTAIEIFSYSCRNEWMRPGGSPSKIENIEVDRYLRFRFDDGGAFVIAASFGSVLDELEITPGAALPDPDRSETIQLRLTLGR